MTWVAETQYFKYFVTLLIIANSTFVGYEMQVGMFRALDGNKSLNTAGEDRANDVFAGLFTIELIIRILAYRLHFFLGEEWMWNMFDFCIVLNKLISVWINYEGKMVKKN